MLVKLIEFKEFRLEVSEFRLEVRDSRLFFEDIVRVLVDRLKRKSFVILEE